MAQLKDLIVNGPTRIIGDLYGTNAIFNGNITPNSNATSDIGSSDNKWRTIYAATFNGAVAGTSSTAINAQHAQTAHYATTSAHAYTANFASSATYASLSSTASWAVTAYRAVAAANSTTAGNATVAGSATYAISSGSASYAGTAGSANSVAWSNVSGKVSATTAAAGIANPADMQRLYSLFNTTAYCTTAAATAAKVAICDGYTLTAYTYIHVIFTIANSASSALTLNINSKGAKTIYINGTISSSSNKTLPAGSYLVYYNGTNYYLRTDGILPGPRFTQSVDGIDIATVDNPVHYGVCGTAGDTAAKVCPCAGFSLITGSRIIVNFTNANTATNPTININSTGAKNIKYDGANIDASLIKANSFLELVYDGSAYQYVGSAGGGVKVGVFASPSTVTTKYFIVGQSGTTESSDQLYKASGATTANGYGIYFTPKERVLMGAAWNDYAEFRKPKEKNIEPGRVVKENGDGTLSLTTERLERGCEIVSDTYGFSIGKSDINTLPIAVSGRVLAYTWGKAPQAFTIGAPVCSGPFGTVSEMTDEEERLYPSRIIGTVSEIPNYEIWHGANDIEVKNRIWIRVR